jgi:hypothetical protein
MIQNRIAMSLMYILPYFVSIKIETGSDTMKPGLPDGIFSKPKLLIWVKFGGTSYG